MTYPSLRHRLKRLRYAYRRARAASRWGAEALASAPAVLGNAMPKSGSHLLIQILHGLVDLGPFVNPGYPPVNRTEGNRKLPDESVLAAVRAMQPGEIRYGYLQAQEPWISAVTGKGRATIFAYRDPRDWVVSQVFYATDMHEGHMLHAYYNSLPTVEARINAAIEGVDLPQVRAPSLVERYRRYLGWIGMPGVLSVRFEDLIENRRVVIGDMLDYLATFNVQPAAGRSRALEILESGIAPHRSGTFRRGTPGEWRERFTEDNLRRFQDATGDLLASLGYDRPH